jgi:hypothetical protein
MKARTSVSASSMRAASLGKRGRTSATCRQAVAPAAASCWAKTVRIAAASLLCWPFGNRVSCCCPKLSLWANPFPSILDYGNLIRRTRPLPPVFCRPRWDPGRGGRFLGHERGSPAIDTCSVHAPFLLPNVPRRSDAQSFLVADQFRDAWHPMNEILYGDRSLRRNDHA